MEHRAFSDYLIYENGTVINRFGNVVKSHIKDGRYEIRLINDKGVRKSYILSRLMYWLFVERFDYDDKNLCITYKDGDKLNINPLNLELKHRKEIIQGEGHKARVKLTDEQREEIIKAYEGNESGANQYSENRISYADLAEKYGTTKANIAAIVKGRSRNPDNYKLK